MNNTTETTVVDRPEIIPSEATPTSASVQLTAVDVLRQRFLKLHPVVQDGVFATVRPSSCVLNTSSVQPQ